MRLPQIIGGILITSIVGLGGWLVYDVTATRRAEETLRTELARLMEELPAARIRCDAIEPDPAGGPPRMSLRWAPVGDDGRLLEGASPRHLELRGGVAYFDTYQIIFQEDLVKEGDPFRGRTLTLFARAFGDAQAPRDGVPLDVPEALVREDDGQIAGGANLVPASYRIAREGRVADLEARLWRRFWDLALDPEYAASEGVRTAQGTAASIPMVAGREYTLTVKRDGQILITAEQTPLFPTP